MKKILHIFLFFCLLIILTGTYYLYGSFQDSRSQPERTSLNNVYVVSASGGSIRLVSEVGDKEYPLAGEAEKIHEGIAKIQLEDGKVVKVSLMPEMVSGKVLSVTEQEVEIEGYGKIPFHSDFKAYQLGAPVTFAKEDKIVIGYSTTKFVVADGKVQGAVIAQAAPPEQIRVLLKTSDYSSYNHEKVIVTGTEDFCLRQGKQETWHKKGEKVEIKGSERASVSSKSGKIQLLTLKRQNRNPKYRGIIEVVNTGKGFHIINELSFEEYLYSVVPSEMPVTYGKEALKAQAVCARSYGYSQILAGKLRKYGAHVDDSVSYQVYNNVTECSAAREAVNETKGQVLTKDGKTAVTYFFSTSCGITSGVKDVWYTKQEISYLKSKLQKLGSGLTDLSGEDNFRTFIKKKNNWFDSDSVWYRWNVQTNTEAVRKSLEANLVKRYEANPTHIQVKTGSGFTSKKISSVGEVKKVQIIKRGKSGVVKCIQVEGSEAVIRIYTEYNIRLLLFGANSVIKDKNGIARSGASMLPSGFFYLEQSGNTIRFHGGGYGHGVGMSQNGAKKMSEMGMKYDIILMHYYEGTSITSLC